MQRATVTIEAAGRREVVEAGPVAGGKDHGVDVLAGAVAPADPVASRRLNIGRRSGLPEPSAAR